MDVGTLRWGGDPEAGGTDERLVAGHGRVLELRIPWALLTMADPSSHKAWEPHIDGSITTRACRASASRWRRRACRRRPRDVRVERLEPGPVARAAQGRLADPEARVRDRGRLTTNGPRGGPFGCEACGVGS